MTPVAISRQRSVGLCAAGPVRGEHLPLPERRDTVAVHGELPDLSVRLRPELRTDRSPHPRLSALRFDPSADRRSLYRSSSRALLPAGRHGHLGDGARHPGLRAKLSRRGRRGGAARRGIVDLPPGIVAPRAPRLRRRARPGAIDLPGRRKHRRLDRAPARRLYRPARRPKPARLVRRAGALRHRDPHDAVAGTPVSLQTTRPRFAAVRRSPSARATRRVGRAMAILAALIFSKYFYHRELHELLRLLPGSSRFQVTQQTAQICLFVFLGAVAAWNPDRRPCGRPDRPQDRHLGVDPRHPAVHAGPPLREPADYDRAQRRDRA